MLEFQRRKEAISFGGMAEGESSQLGNCLGLEKEYAAIKVIDTLIRKVMREGWSQAGDMALEFEG